MEQLEEKISKRRQIFSCGKASSYLKLRFDNLELIWDQCAKGSVWFYSCIN